MTARVYDWDGVEKDWGWLQETYGNVRVIEAAAGANSAAFRLKEIHVSHAEATLQVGSFNANGTARQGDHVCNTWPGIVVDPKHGNVDLRGDPSLKTVYRPIACVQSTDVNGQTGFGLGTGSYIQDMAAGGPNAVWITSPSYPSDVVDGIGMLGGTPHWGPLRPVFVLDESGGGGDTGGGGGDTGGDGGGDNTVKGLVQAALAQVTGIAEKLQGALDLIG
jgi:hypothetical protein